MEESMNKDTALPEVVDEMDRLKMQNYLLKKRILEADGDKFLTEFRAYMAESFRKYCVPDQGSIDAETGKITR